MINPKMRSYLNIEATADHHVDTSPLEKSNGQLDRVLDRGRTTVFVYERIGFGPGNEAPYVTKWLHYDIQDAAG